MNLPRITILYAVMLILLGLAGYFATGMASVTALIPSFFGAAVLAAGFLALKDPYRKHAMHAASLLALLGIIGTAGGFGGLFKVLAGRDVERPEAAISKSIMALLSVVFFALCLWSFIKARLTKN